MATQDTLWYYLARMERYRHHLIKADMINMEKGLFRSFQFQLYFFQTQTKSNLKAHNGVSKAVTEKKFG